VPRFLRYIEKWKSSYPRCIKMTMKVFKLPGWTLRGLCLMPSDKELQQFTESLLRLRLPEIDELARAARLTVPA
jgi:hypothetical protein